MAARFWVGGTGNWGVTTTNWSATSGGAGGASVPTSADDVTFDANSGVGTVTVTATSNCANFTSTNFGGTFTGAFLLNVFGSMTLGGTWTYSGTLTFAATATGKTINTNGKTLAGPVTFDGVGGGWTLAAALATSGAVTLTNGAFSDGGFSLSALSFLSNNSNTRSVTKTGNWTFSGSGSVITFATITGLTASFDTTKSWTLTGNTATATTVAFGSLTQSTGTLKVTAGTYALTLSGMSNAVGSVVDVDFTGFAGSLASATFSMSGALTLGSGMTVTDGNTTANFVGSGAMTLKSNGVQFNRNVTVNGTGALTLQDALNTGTRIITHTQGGLSDGGFSVTTFSLTSTNSNTRSFTKTGNWTITGSGTVITFATTTGLTASFDATKDWLLTYTGATTTAVNFSTSSLAGVGNLKFSGSGTYSVQITGSHTSGTFGNIDFTGFSGAWSTGLTQSLTGNLKLSATMTCGNTATQVTFCNSTPVTITNNGVTVNRQITINGTSTVTLADAMNLGPNVLTITAGTFIDAGFSVTASTFSNSNSNIRAVTKTGAWTLNGVGVVISMGTTTNLTWSDAGGWTLTDSSASSRTVSTLALLMSNIKVTGGSGTFIVTASGNYGGLDFTGSTVALSNTSFTMYAGDLILGAGMTVADGTQVTTFTGTGTQYVKSNGVAFNRFLTINCTGTVKLQDAINLGGRSMTLTAGGFDDQGFSYTALAFISSGSGVRSIAKTAQWTITGPNTCVSLGTTTNLTASFAGGWNLTDSSATARTFAGGGLTFGDLAVSAGTGTMTISGNGTTFRNIDFSGYTGQHQAGATVIVLGNVTLGSGMTTVSTGNTWTFSGGGVQTFTSNGVSWNRSTRVANGTTFSLGDAFSNPQRSLIINDFGSILTNNKTVAVAQISSLVAGGVRTIDFGSSTLTFSTSLVFALSLKGPNLTFNGSASTIILVDTSGATQEIESDGFIFGTIKVTGAAGMTAIITGSNTIASLILDTPGKTLEFGAGTTQTIAALSIAGSAGNLNTISSDTPGAQCTVVNGTGAKVSVDYMAAQDMIGLPGYSWFMGDHSTNLGNNLGVAFCSPANASMMELAA